jgi:hypothetical protein
LIGYVKNAEQGIMIREVNVFFAKINLNKKMEG